MKGMLRESQVDDLREVHWRSECGDRPVREKGGAGESVSCRRVPGSAWNREPGEAFERKKQKSDLAIVCYFLSRSSLVIL